MKVWFKCKNCGELFFDKPIYDNCPACRLILNSKKKKKELKKGGEKN